ncbi:replication-relaxation family protein [Bacillus nakamurai]|uniref:Replication-relaxation n=1 Tax=Bacillus nakamurai TaxID=1793963 RepID=A0A150FCR8_9BACI|nr:replication-relaxation family protein [Bacillus nakamurai]KXZ22288.1 hypothetical protein AXI58_09845 [Bacillus nakamurai]MED1228494.1 replication-relaxation family protein [Bacillus nakamurai]
MKQRDKDIIDALTHFRALNRDQIAELFFSHTKSPSTNANFTLKRLRDRGYIDANINHQPYTYFPKPMRIKKDGQKVNHFLAIADFYIQLKNAGGVKMFHVEPNYTEYVRPDACTIWRKTAWFIEVQCSHYTQKTMSEKMSRYQTYFNSGEWKSLQFQKENSPFPFVWIIGEHQYKIKTDGIRVFQSKSVEDFLMRYVEKKQKELA